MMPRLTPCSSSPPGGRQQQHEDVEHLRHHRLRLADADGLDQHDVEARRLAERDRLARPAGDAAQMRGRGGGADIGVRVAGSAAPSASCRRGSSRRVRVEDGSTASTATRCPCPVSIVPNVSMNVDLPTPGVPDMPMRSASPVSAQTASSSAAARARWSARVLSTSVIARASARRSPATRGARRGSSLMVRRRARRQAVLQGGDGPARARGRARRP